MSDLSSKVKILNLTVEIPTSPPKSFRGVISYKPIEFQETKILADTITGMQNNKRQRRSFDTPPGALIKKHKHNENVDLKNGKRNGKGKENKKNASHLSFSPINVFNIRNDIRRGASPLVLDGLKSPKISRSAPISPVGVLLQARSSIHIRSQSPSPSPSQSETTTKIQIPSSLSSVSASLSCRHEISRDFTMNRSPFSLSTSRSMCPISPRHYIVNSQSPPSSSPPSSSPSSSSPSLRVLPNSSASMSIAMSTIASPVASSSWSPSPSFISPSPVPPSGSPISPSFYSSSSSYTSVSPQLSLPIFTMLPTSATKVQIATKDRVYVSPFTHSLTNVASPTSLTRCNSVLINLPKAVLLQMTCYLSIQEIVILTCSCKTMQREIKFFSEKDSVCHVRRTLEFSQRMSAFACNSEICGCRIPYNIWNSSDAILNKDKFMKLLKHKTKTHISLAYMNFRDDTNRCDILNLISKHVGPELESLDLSGIQNISPNTILDLFKSCHGIKKLILRGCDWLDDQTLIQCISIYLPCLQELDISCCVKVGMIGLCHVLLEHSSTLTSLQVTDLPLVFSQTLSLNTLRNLICECKYLTRLVIGRMAQQPCRSYLQSLKYFPMYFAAHLQNDDAMGLHDGFFEPIVKNCNSLTHLSMGLASIDFGTLGAIAQHCPNLCELELMGCDSIDDDDISRFLKRHKTPLVTLNLIGCKNISGVCLADVATKCNSHLRRLEITCRNARIKEMQQVFNQCTNLSTFVWDNPYHQVVHYFYESKLRSNSLQELRIISCQGSDVSSPIITSPSTIPRKKLLLQDGKSKAQNKAKDKFDIITPTGMSTANGTKTYWRPNTPLSSFEFDSNAKIKRLCSQFSNLVLFQQNKTIINL